MACNDTGYPYNYFHVAVQQITLIDMVIGKATVFPYRTLNSLEINYADC